MYLGTIFSLFFEFRSIFYFTMKMYKIRYVYTENISLSMFCYMKSNKIRKNEKDKSTKIYGTFFCICNVGTIIAMNL